MGIAGVMMMGVIICIAKFFISIFKYLRMILTTRPAVGRIGPPQKIKCYGEPDIDYASEYNFYVECDGKNYESTYKRGEKENIQQGMEIKVRWSERDNDYVMPNKMWKEALVYLAIAIVCGAIFMLCAFIATSIE